MQVCKSKAMTPKSLYEKAGFTLAVFDADGNELDCVSFHTTNPQSMTREEYIVVSVAESLVYSYRFMQLSQQEREAFMANLHDVKRKINDLISALDQ